MKYISKFLKNNRLINLIFSLGIGLFLCACSNSYEEAPIVAVDTLDDEITYNTEETSIGDVILTQNLTCSYKQTKEQEVRFSNGGKIIEKVYVKNGDYVNVGDTLVELQVGNLIEDIASLEFQIKKNTLLLSYLDKAEEFDLQNSYYSMAYDSEKDEDAVKAKDKRDENIKEGYTYQREDYSDNIEFDELKLEQLKAELASSRINATLSGKVIDIKKDLEGSTSKKDEVIMKIVDNNNGLFETENKDASLFFKEGQSINMTIVYGDAKGEYILEPYSMSSWGDKQLFQIVEGPDGYDIEVGTTGNIIAPIDQRENVLRIPNNSLYQADGKYYTYVLDENNMRQAQFLEIGLIGDDYSEVISGIKEGVKVVKR